jgi:hypothetical protein
MLQPTKQCGVPLREHIVSPVLSVVRRDVQYDEYNVARNAQGGRSNVLRGSTWYVDKKHSWPCPLSFFSSHRATGVWSSHPTLKRSNRYKSIKVTGSGLGPTENGA